MKHVTYLLAAIGLFMVVSAASATNVADLTGSYLEIPSPFYKVADDGGPWYAYVSQPLGKNVSASLMSCHDEDSHENELTLSVVMSPKCQVAFISNYHNEGDETTESKSVMLDLADGRFGLGMISSLEGEGTQLGFRAKTGDFTLFLTVKDGEESLPGISYTKSGLKVELARGSETTWCRISRPFGKITPELRLQFRGDESVFGFAIGFCPQ